MTSFGAGNQQTRKGISDRLQHFQSKVKYIIGKTHLYFLDNNDREVRAILMILSSLKEISPTTNCSTIARYVSQINPQRSPDVQSVLYGDKRALR
jgi:hypothetical protein